MVCFPYPYWVARLLEVGLTDEAHTRCKPLKRFCPVPHVPCGTVLLVAGVALTGACASFVTVEVKAWFRAEVPEVPELVDVPDDAATVPDDPPVRSGGMAYCVIGAVDVVEVLDEFPR